MSLHGRPTVSTCVSRFLLIGIAFVPAGACQHLQSHGPSRPTVCENEVYTGYGSVSRRTFTGSAESRPGADLRGQPGARLDERLDGRFAGLEVVRLPNGEFSLRIRGTRSSLGGGEPLVVIDGVSMPHWSPGPLLGLMPQNIARIDILKDAGSTAMYGVRGANGVIVITTRGGADGRRAAVCASRPTTSHVASLRPQEGVPPG